MVAALLPCLLVLFFGICVVLYFYSVLVTRMFVEDDIGDTRASDIIVISSEVYVQSAGVNHIRFESNHGPIGFVQISNA